jgi:hypothetical protein
MAAGIVRGVIFQERCVWGEAYEDENSLGGMLPLLAGFEIPEQQAVDLGISTDLFDDGIPDHFGLGIPEELILEYLLGSELIPPMDEPYFAPEASQIVSLFDGRVAASNDGYNLSIEEGPITYGAIADAAAGELFFAGHAEFSRRAPSRDDDRQGAIEVIFGPDLK